MEFDTGTVKRNQRKITSYLKERYKEEGKKIGKDGRNFLVKASRIGEDLKPKMSSYKVCKSMHTLVEAGVVEDSELSNGAILWRTCFGKKNECRKRKENKI